MSVRPNMPIKSNISIRYLDEGYLVYKEGAAYEYCQAEYACETIERVIDVVTKLLLLDEEESNASST